MKTLFYLLVSLSAICFNLHLGAQNRSSSAPFISGDTFRSFADFIFDETGNTVDVDQIKRGSIIFVKTDMLEAFFETVHPSIPHPYILISHNADHSVSRSFASRLEDEKILAWFAQNVEDFTHPKLHPIPIGIANRYWGHGDLATFSCKQQQLATSSIPKSILLYMNISVWTCSSERAPVYSLFSKKPFCTTAEPGKSLSDYLDDLIRSKFVISPRGNGLDCHRTWEALYMGAIPIVRSSSLDPLFEDLPVLIIHDWAEVTEEFLLRQYDILMKRPYNLKKLYFDYFIDHLLECGSTLLE